MSAACQFDFKVLRASVRKNERQPGGFGASVTLRKDGNDGRFRAVREEFRASFASRASEKSVFRGVVNVFNAIFSDINAVDARFRRGTVERFDDETPAGVDRRERAGLVDRRRNPRDLRVGERSNVERRGPDRRKKVFRAKNGRTAS